MSHIIKAIGVMSGTSLDGLDICVAEFGVVNGFYSYKLLHTETISYSEEWKDKLKNGFHLSKTRLETLDFEFGKFIGNSVNGFIEKNDLGGNIDLIGSHGHTIFHEPDKGITVQIGSGKVIRAKTRINVINDFRINDVKLGGQGAPLVPIGDKLLFEEFEACLNLGGFANISFEQNRNRIAFDISPANLPLNELVKEEMNLSYDDKGEIAKSGNTIESLVNSLDKISFYHQNHPKSLGVEWLNENFYPIVNEYSDKSIEDRLNSIIEHETNQISKVLNQNKLKSVLITGGGVHNEFFIECLKRKTDLNFFIPSHAIVEFKEALIFAFLAYLNLTNQVNTLRSVTGASVDSIGGIRHFIE